MYFAQTLAILKVVTLAMQQEGEGNVFTVETLRKTWAFCFYLPGMDCVIVLLWVRLVL